jgi:hypothetical protein
MFPTAVHPIRDIATKRWTLNMESGGWRYNTHHLTYQFILPCGEFVSIPPFAIECSDAEFDRYLAKVIEARNMIKSEGLSL